MTPPQHTDSDIEQAAQRFEQIADELNAATARVERAGKPCAVTGGAYFS
jgi:hypothetical protein